MRDRPSAGATQRNEAGATSGAAVFAAMSLAAALPKPKNSYEAIQDPVAAPGQGQHGGGGGGDGAAGRKKKAAVVIPPYGQRRDFVPRSVEVSEVWLGAGSRSWWWRCD